MRILAIDHGDKRIGLAICDEEERVAVPYGMMENRGTDFVVQEFTRIVHEERIEKMLVGLPLHIDERATNAQLQKVHRFIGVLRGALQVTIETIDERFSSVEADRRVEGIPKKLRAQRDALAATIFLQDYLDQRGR